VYVIQIKNKNRLQITGSIRKVMAFYWEIMIKS